MPINVDPIKSKALTRNLSTLDFSDKYKDNKS